MITNENCGLSPQATCLLVNLFTRQEGGVGAAVEEIGCGAAR